jgi:hypothetical protein
MMHNRYINGTGTAMVLAALLCFPATVGAEKLPPLWGYAVKSCADYLAAVEADAAGTEVAAWELRRYEDWLTGIVSGLNLATGKDVLVGADIQSALRRIGAYCRGHPQDDFFTATMDLVRSLSRL